MKTKTANTQQEIIATFTGKSRHAVEKAIERAKARNGPRWDAVPLVKDDRFSQWNEAHVK